MMNFGRGLFLLVVLSLALLGTVFGGLTPQEKIMARINSLEQTVEVLREHIDAHESGEKPLDDAHYESKIYREQILLRQIEDIRSEL